MWQLLSFVIPVGIGSALSPTLLAVSTGIVSQPVHPRKRGLFFFLGALISLCLWTLLVYSALWAYIRQLASDVESDISFIDVALGIVLLLFALYLVVFKPRGLFDEHKANAGMAGESDADQHPHVGRYWSLGFFLEGRDISTVVLFISGAQHIATADVPLAAKAATLAGLLAMATSPTWVPLFARISIPSSVTSRIRPAMDWLRANARIITISVCLVFGIYLVVHGVRS